MKKGAPEGTPNTHCKEGVLSSCNTSQIQQGAVRARVLILSNLNTVSHSIWFREKAVSGNSRMPGLSPTCEFDFFAACARILLLHRCKLTGRSPSPTLELGPSELNWVRIKRSRAIGDCNTQVGDKI